MEFVLPFAEAQTSYRSFVEEFRSRQEPLIPWVLSWESGDFQQLLQRLQAAQTAAGVEHGMVEHSTYWMLDVHGEVVGVANLRHRLNASLRRCGGHIGYGVLPSFRGRGIATELLRYTLERAHALGITRALLFSHEENSASIRVIEKNGGRYQGLIQTAEGILRRYWIDAV